MGEGADLRNIHSHVASRAKVKQPGLKARLSFLSAGDVLIVWKLDHLGLSLPHLVTLLGELLFNIIAYIAKFDRLLLRERVNAELAAAQARPGG